MLEALPHHIAKDVDMALHEKLWYPTQFRYGKECEMLPALAIKLKLKNVLHFEKVQRQLGLLSRVTIDTKQDYNCAICLVNLQLKLPKYFKNDAVQHQIAAHMIKDYNFYYQKMQKYLNAHNLSYSAYILYLYSGIIWADEYMLGALGRMFDVKISVVSPANANMWNIFHESGLPHVVIVANRGYFGKKHGVTHFSAMKGSETIWKYVCADINVGELGMWRGYDNGLRRTAAKFMGKEKMILLSDTHKVTTDVQDLCHNLNQLCIRRDRIYSEIDSMGIKVDAFKRFNTFIYKRANSKEETEHVHKKSSGKHKKSKESKPEKRSSRACGKFPKEVRERVLGDAVAELNKQNEGTEVPEQSVIDEVLRSHPGGCQIKNARKPFFPSLPAEVASAEKDDKISEILMTEKSMKRWPVSSEIQKPYNFDIPQIHRTEEPGVVHKWAMSPEAKVIITEQPQKEKDDNFCGEKIFWKSKNKKKCWLKFMQLVR